MAARHGSPSTSNCPLCSLLALAATNQLSCTSSAQLPRSKSTQNCQVHTIQPRWSFQPVCNQMAWLQSVASFAALPCTISVQQQSVSSAVICKLSCNLSTLAYSVVQLICCDRPAAKHQLSCKVQPPLQSVISAAICLLSHDLSAWQQSVSSVSSVAKRQLSCKVSAQLSSAAI